MKMRGSFCLIMRHIIHKTIAVMEIGPFTIRDFSKGISDFCDRLFSDKELLGIFAVIIRKDICVCDICFRIKSRRRSIKTENTAGCRDRRCTSPHIIQHRVFCNCMRVRQEQISGFRVIRLNGPEHSDQSFLHQVIHFEQVAGITLFGYLRR